MSDGRKPRTCEVCGNTYEPTYNKQRSCSRACGLIIRFGSDVYSNSLSKTDLDAPTQAEQLHYETERRKRISTAMLARYHADPRNWTTARKRRKLFERDGWRCRSCGKLVSDAVHRTHRARAVAGHIVAKASGGQWTEENMATLCYPCNVRDGVNKIPLQMHCF